jgi:hypothetical protein
MIEGGRDPARYSGLALLVVVVGVLITAVDTTIVVLALPEIQRSLHVGLSSVIWGTSPTRSRSTPTAPRSSSLQQPSPPSEPSTGGDSPSLTAAWRLGRR